MGGPLLGWSCGRGAPAGKGASTGSSGASGTGSSTGSADASSSGNGPDSSSGSSSGGSGPGDDASSESDSGTAVTGDASTAPPAVGGVANWPQAAGPNGTWRVNAANAPTSWSVAANQNIVWRQPLPNEGQGGIAVWGDTLFLETFPPGVSIRSLDVVGHAIDKSTGKIKWSTPVMHGNGYAQASLLASSWSDATSWTPITDGQYVWFFNAAGHMGCWPVGGGNAVWERDFPGQRAMYPFNRNHEPILYGNTIIILSELGMGDPPPKVDGWEYLHGIDKMTGKTLWVADDASTFFNTAVMGTLPNGMPAVMHGRGGPHAVPERPVGLSMTSLAPGSEGKMLWQFPANSGEALYNMVWDGKYGYWFTVSPNETMQVIDAATGKLVHNWSLFQPVDVRFFDTTTQQYVLHAGVNIHTLADPTYGGTAMHVMPGWTTNIAANGYVWFLASTNNMRTGPPGHAGPAHAVGRVNVETGKAEYLELPVGVSRSPNMPQQLVYGKTLTTTCTDFSGNVVAAPGTQASTDGWAVSAFYPSPIVVGNKIYFSVTLGITYVIDANAAVLDEKAILGYGDLGPLGQTWSLAGPSFAGGLMYHHSSKEVVAIHP
ncbi:MAG TPA: PQQ-binding-like beta-propeller repeat protein [Polyangia bacterium]|nr:PQQ-binding-like beta-propeller repeat protein [Polyangia bacterium]